MVINKELYERYKAMKAAKLAAEKETETTKVPITELSPLNSTASKEPQFNQSNISPQPSVQNQYQEYDTIQTKETSSQDLNSSNWTTTYSQSPTPVPTQALYSQSIIDNYNAQFAPSQTMMTPTPTLEPMTLETQVTKSQESQIKKFALIGYPLDHSISEYIHNAGFKSIGINATYEIMPTPPEELSERIKYLRSNGYTGFNVTIPLKLPVSLFIDEIDESANIVKAINTITINPVTNALKGYNTDVTGFIKAIPQNIPLYNKIVAILGSGGAARAAITALALKQVKEIRIYTRNIANCISLIDYCRKTFPNVIFNSYQIDRAKDLSDVNLLVNATPIGMSGQGVGYTPIEDNEVRTLPPDAIVYDVIYTPKKTNLIKLAQKYNYKTINGIDMLIYQALEAEKFWTGKTPDFKDMKIAALENL